MSISRAAACALMLATLLSGSAYAQNAAFYFSGPGATPNPYADPQTLEICEAARPYAPPASDALPVAPDARPGAGAYEAYYGIGGPRDFALARALAFAEWDRSQSSDEVTGLGGEAVLMMLYANGEGVTRDPDIAIHMACSIGSAAIAETGQRVARLQAMKHAVEPTGPFDFCDDVTSGFASSECAWRDLKIVLSQQQDQDVALTRGWPAEMRARLAALREAQAGFARARSEHESWVGGLDPWKAAYATWLETQTHKESQQLLSDLMEDRWPAPSAGGVAEADSLLNDFYRKVLAGPRIDEERVTPEGVRATERAWLTYRDAWLAFVRLRKPEAEQAIFQALTEARARQLRCLLEDSVDDSCEQIG